MTPKGFGEDIDVAFAVAKDERVLDLFRATDGRRARRLAALEEQAGIDAFAAELIDRFGPLPDEVENLLQIVALKKLCREAGVEKVDAGVRGAAVSFRKDHFANPAGLVAWITGHGETAKLRPDHTLVLMRDWQAPAERMQGVRYLIGELARIAGEGEGRETGG